MTIVEGDSSIVIEWSSKLIDAARGVIYDRHMFIVQATDDLRQANRRNITEDTTLDLTVAKMANAFVYY